MPVCWVGFITISVFPFKNKKSAIVSCFKLIHYLEIFHLAFHVYYNRSFLI